MRRVHGVAIAAFGWALALGGIGCESPAPEEAPDTVEAPSTPSPNETAVIPFAARFDASGAYRLAAAVPRAYRRGDTLRAAKADEWDDDRAAAPENYAITSPPLDIANVRPLTEWEQMSALVFAYPYYTALLDQASDTFVQIAKHASDYGQVWILVDGSQSESVFKQKLSRAGVGAAKVGTVIKFLRTNLQTVWLIDYGPLPLIDLVQDSYAFADFRYYHKRPFDDAVPTVLGRNLPRLGEAGAATTFRMPLNTEGGTFQATGDGVCITGSRQISNMSCLTGAPDCDAILGLSLSELQVHPNTVEMRGTLAAYAGCQDLIVTHSISDDGTGHIDMYLKILDDRRILLGDFREPFDNDMQQENAILMNDNAAFLEAYVKPDGGRFVVKRLPMPGHRTITDDQGFRTELPFTYINSTFFNGLNLWPAYSFANWTHSRADAEAIWKEVLPDMEHVWIDTEELAYQSGAIHCVTRTIPAKKAAPWVAEGTCADGVCGSAAGGYDGACTVRGASDLCYGPDWLCGCNDCHECPLEVPDTACGSVDWRGCCEGGDVLFCQNARLQREPCAGTGCGWDGGEGFYGCGLVGDDPSGANPSSCTCRPACDGKTCGDDGCGGSCGTCTTDALCIAGDCRADCSACIVGDVGCDGADATRCVLGIGGCNSLERVDCASNGLACVEGDCVAVAAEPDVVEAESDVTRAPDDTGQVPDGVRGVGPGARDDGCAGGGPGGEILFVLGLIVAASRGRRGQVGGHVVVRRA